MTTLGQLNLFDDPTPPARPKASTGNKAKKRHKRTTWQGSKSCRACGHYMFDYRHNGQLGAWVEPDIVANCPGCGIKITTTSIEPHDDPRTTHRIGDTTVTTLEVRSVIDNATTDDPDSSGSYWVGPVSLALQEVLAAVAEGQHAWASTEPGQRFGSSKDYKVAGVVKAARDRAPKQTTLWDQPEAA